MDPLPKRLSTSRPASGAKRLIGFEVDNSRADGCSIVTLDVGPQHMNLYGIAHGGIVAVLLDTACGQTASTYFDPVELPAIVTVSLTVSFLSPCLPKRVTCLGRPIGGGRKTVTCEAELHDETGTLLAKATGVFRNVGGPGK